MKFYKVKILFGWVFCIEDELLVEMNIYRKKIIKRKCLFLIFLFEGVDRGY